MMTCSKVSSTSHCTSPQSSEPQLNASLKIVSQFCSPQLLKLAMPTATSHQPDCVGNDKRRNRIAKRRDDGEQCRWSVAAPSGNCVSACVHTFGYNALCCTLLRWRSNDGLICIPYEQWWCIFRMRGIRLGKAFRVMRRNFMSFVVGGTASNTDSLAHLTP